jgi:hypothetical protein
VPEKDEKNVIQFHAGTRRFVFGFRCGKLVTSHSGGGIGYFGERWKICTFHLDKQASGNGLSYGLDNGRELR